MTERPAISGSMRHAAQPSRTQPRRKTFHPVVLRIGDDRHRAHMLNLSTGGACIHAGRAPLQLAHSVRVEVGGWTLPARVSWIAGERCGIRFLKPLTVTDVEKLVE